MVTDWTNTNIFVTLISSEEIDQKLVKILFFTIPPEKFAPILIETGKPLKIGDSSYIDLIDNSLVDCDLNFRPVKSFTRENRRNGDCKFDFDTYKGKSVADWGRTRNPNDRQERYFEYLDGQELDPELEN